MPRFARTAAQMCAALALLGALLLLLADVSRAASISDQSRDAAGDARPSPRARTDAGAQVASAFFDPRTREWTVRPTVDASAAATIRFFDDMMNSGWDTLYIETHAQHDDMLQAFGAGLLEGMLTCKRITQMTNNYMRNEYGHYGAPTNPEFVQFFRDQERFLVENIRKRWEDPAMARYWRAHELLLEQFEGLYEGYKRGCGNDPHAIDRFQLYLLNSAGDLGTLNEVLNHTDPAVARAGARARAQAEDNMLDCSSIVQMCYGDELVAGHTTWRMYYAMVRIFKFYTFAYQSVGLREPYTVSVASTPGFLSSKDDFYVTSHGLIVMETTNGIYDLSLYKRIVPQVSLSWQRVMVANMLNRNGDPWTTMFAMHNSGTYNNQWIVLDKKLFTPGQSTLPPNSLWILEQIPGYTERADVTDTVNKQGFWPSYNVPYFKSIFNMSGYPQMVATRGDDFSYEKCSRARLFAEYGTKVNRQSCVRDATLILQANDYLHNPISNGNPAYAISSRYDLRTTNPSAFGGIDTKIHYAHAFANTTTALGISGPTHQSLPPFSWSQNPAFDKVYHEGLPETYDFDWHLLTSTPSAPVPQQV